MANINETRRFTGEVVQRFDGYTVERRRDDFMAYVNGTGKTKWEAGKTAEQAVRKLKTSHPEIR